MEDQVTAAQRGDPLAMDALLTELAPWVGRLCSAIALSRGEDAMQETLILVLRNLPTLREPARTGKDLVRRGRRLQATVRGERTLRLSFGARVESTRGCRQVEQIRRAKARG